MRIEYRDFIACVEANDGEALPTIGGRRQFVIHRMDHGVSFTPKSSGIPRRLNRESIQRYLDFFNATQSIKTSDYSERHRNQSYVLAIINLIRGQAPDAALVDDGTSDTDNIDPEFNAPEGKAVVRSHRRRERSRELVQMAKKVFRAKHGRLFCQVCRFDFGEVYGDPDFIEAHHLIPLRDLEPGTRTKLSDLAIVCANCHRMLHRGRPWPTISELKRRLPKNRR